MPVKKAEVKEEVQEEVRAVPRGPVNMKIVLDTGKTQTFTGSLMSDVMHQAGVFCQENGKDFRNPDHVKTWEKM
jgi:hypothetical protein